MFKLVYSYKANPHFSDEILQKRFSSYIQVNLGILFLLDKQKNPICIVTDQIYCRSYMNLKS